MNEVIEQFIQEIEEATRRIAVVIGDPDTAIDWPEESRARATLRAGFAVMPLLSDDPREAADTAAGIMTALWPHGDPDQVGRATWWSTPLGIAVARTLPTDRTVTYTQAAEILNITRSTVQTYLTRGYLTATPDGITLVSVLHYLARRAGPAASPRQAE